MAEVNRESINSQLDHTKQLSDSVVSRNRQNYEDLLQKFLIPGNTVS